MSGPSKPNSVIRGLILRALLSPQIPGACDSLNMAPTDLRRMYLFGGLVSKVQHNFVRDRIPITHHLLQHQQLELEFFAQFRACWPPTAIRGMDRDSRCQAVLKSLEDFLSRSARVTHAAISAVLAHECALHQIRCQTEMGREQRIGRVSGRPKHCDGYRVHPADSTRLVHLNFSPEHAADSILKGRIPKRASQYRCYFRSGRTSDIQVMRLSKTTWDLFMGLSDRPKLKEAVQNFSARFNTSPIALRNYLLAAFDQGMVALTRESAVDYARCSR